MKNKIQTGFLVSLSFILISCFSLTLAEDLTKKDPYNFVEVNANNKSKCIKYFKAKDKLYCSTTEPTSQKKPKAFQTTNEHLNLTFDQRHWVSAWDQKTPNMVTVEYIVSGDNLNSWKELVTSQFVPGTKQRLTPPQYANSVMNTLKKQFPKIQTQYLIKTEKEVIFEFKMSQPAAMAQHEIQRAFLGKDGMYIVHYAIKKPDMGTTANKKWLHLLKQAHPKQTASSTK